MDIKAIEILEHLRDVLFEDYTVWRGYKRKDFSAAIRQLENLEIVQKQTPELPITVDDLETIEKSIVCKKIKDGMIDTHEFAKLEERLEDVIQVLEIDTLGLNTDDLGVLTISVKWICNYTKTDVRHDLKYIAEVLTEFFRKEPQS